MFRKLVAISILLSCIGCQEIVFDIDHTNDPEGNFEALWSEFDQLYGLFRIKQLDWDSVYSVYRPQVDRSTSQMELYQILVEMLEILDDGHVVLLPVGTNLPQYVGGPRGKIDTTQDFSLEVVKSQYLSNAGENEMEMTYGEIGNGIGYFHIPYFSGSDKDFSDATTEMIDRFQNTRGLIIDLRGGDGGDDIASKAIASHFTDKRRHYMNSRIKNGPGPEDFTGLQQWFIEPRENTYLKPVVLLTHRQTISATETFVLAMKTLPQVTLVGDTTAGAFSNLALRELPNGWIYTMSIGEWTDAQGVSHEGLGIIPDSLVENTRPEILSGIDRALEAAVQRLEE